MCRNIGNKLGEVVKGKINKRLSKGRIYKGNKYKNSGGFDFMCIAHPRWNASLTVEAAFVFPLSFYVLYGVLYLFIFLHTQFQVYQGLLAVSDKLYGLAPVAAYVEQSGIFTDIFKTENVELPEEVKEIISYGVTSFVLGELSTEYIETVFEEYFSESERSLPCVEGDVYGVELENSYAYAGDGSISLRAEYTFEFPAAIFFAKDREVVQSLDVTGFYGVSWDKVKEFEDEKKSNDDSGDEEYVYVAKSGTVYHLDNTCTYISYNLRQVLTEQVENLRNASGGIYYPCEYCARSSPGLNVYITEYGDRYHNSVTCSKISRDVTKVTKKQAEENGKLPCSKCGS